MIHSETQQRPNPAPAFANRSTEVPVEGTKVEASADKLCAGSLSFCLGGFARMATFYTLEKQRHSWNN